MACQEVGPKGRVVGVDLRPLDPPPINENMVAIVGDLADDAVLARVLEELGRPADVLLCDAAPKLTGIRDTDRANEERLLEAIEARIPVLLKPGGDLLVKLLECPEAQAVARRIAAGFDRSRILRPRATRKGSSERYLLARSLQAGTG